MSEGNHLHMATSESMVLACTDFNRKTVDKALNLTVKGYVDLEDEEEAAMVKVFLASLGGKMWESLEVYSLVNDFEQTIFKSEAASLNGSVESEDHTEEVDEMQDVFDCDDDQLEIKNGELMLAEENICHETIGQMSEADEKEEEMDTVLDEATGNMVVKSLKCPLCGKACPRKLTNLKVHLAIVHFKQEIRDLAGSNKESGDGVMCHLCGLRTRKLSKKRKVNLELLSHVGLRHKYLDMVMPDDLKQRLNRHILKALPNTNVGDLFQLEDAAGDFPTCPLCDRIFAFFTDLQRHVATRHFGSRVLEHCEDPDYKHCHLCLKSMGNENSTKWTLKDMMALHLAMQHGYLEKYMDEDLKKKMDAMSKIHTKVRWRPRMEEAAKRRRTAKLTVKTNLRCPMCQANFDNYKSLMGHLSKAHYKKDILSEAKVTEAVIQSQKCHLCQRQLKSNWKKRCEKVNALNRHLAHSHKILDKVMPEEVKRQVNQHLQEAIPAISEKNLVANSRAEEDIGQKCLMDCDKRFRTISAFKTHMIHVHFSADILALGNVTDVTVCNICHSKLRRTTPSESARRYEMARHLALRHDFLAKVVGKRDLKDTWLRAMEHIKKLNEKR